MSYEGAFKSELTPIGKVGENLYLVPLNKYVRIEYVEQLPGDLWDFGAVTSGEKLSYQKITYMDMPEDEIAQWRIKILDDISLSIRQKQGIGRHITKNVMEQSDFRTTIYSGKGNMFEYFVYEDEAPYISAENITNYNIKKSRIFFEGFRYVVTDLANVPDRFTAIPIYGWGTRPGN